MDRQHAIERLPQAYASALLLRDRGFDDAAIAVALALELEAVPVFLGVAEEKLAALISTTTPSSCAVAECAMDTHPWTNYEIARLRDEERLLHAREARLAQEARASEAQLAVAGPADSLIARLMRRGLAVRRAPARSGA